MPEQRADHDEEQEADREQRAPIPQEAPELTRRGLPGPRVDGDLRRRLGVERGGIDPAHFTRTRGSRSP